MRTFSSAHQKKKYTVFFNSFWFSDSVLPSNLQPIFGIIGLALGIGAVVYFGLNNDTPFLGDFRDEKHLNILRIVLYASCAFLAFSGLFFFFSYLWFEAYQLVLFSLFGFYAVWSLDRLYVLIYLILSAFNSFCIAGKFAVLGYNYTLAEQSPITCLQYFKFGSGVSSRCSSGGFLNWLRFLGLSCVIIQPIAAYVTFVLYRRLARGGVQNIHSPGGYGVIKNEPQAAANTSAPSYQTTYQSNKDSQEYI
jgi:hypothetical protein